MARAEADHLRQQPRRAHVGAGEPDLDEQEGDLRLLRHDAEIARERDHRAGAGGDAVDRGDDRLAQRADGADERAGHAREAPAARRASIANSGPMMSCTLPPEQKPRPAPVMHHARAPSLSRSSATKRVAQLGVDLEGERVERVGAIERDGGDAVASTA